MQTIEPVIFEAQGPGIELKDDEYEKKIRYGYHDEWDDTHDSLLSQSIPSDLNEVSPDTLWEKVNELLEGMLDPVNEIAPQLTEEPQKSMWFTPNRSRLPRLTLWNNDDTVVVPNSSMAGNIFVLTNNKDAGRDVRSRLIDRLKEKEKHLNIYGVDNIKISTGEEYAKEITNRSNNVSGIDLGDPDELEQSIRDDLTSVTESILCSCEIQFGGHSANPEYDILLPLSPNHTINIEVKDYAGRDDNPSEEEIIDKPLNQARLLDIDHVFSVSKGIDDELRNQFEQSIELRDNIDIVRENDITDTVRNYIQSESISNIIWCR